MRPVDDNDESSSGGSFGDESSCASGPTSRRKVRSAARERRVEVQDEVMENIEVNVDAARF